MRYSAVTRFGSNRRCDDPRRFNAGATSLSLRRKHVLMLVPECDDDGVARCSESIVAEIRLQARPSILTKFYCETQQLVQATWCSAWCGETSSRARCRESTLSAVGDAVFLQCLQVGIGSNRGRFAVHRRLRKCSARAWGQTFLSAFSAFRNCLAVCSTRHVRINFVLVLESAE